MLKKIAKAVAYAVLAWAIITGILVTLCYLNIAGFSMGYVIATGATSWAVTIGMYGTVVAFGVLYWLAAHLGDTL